MTVLQIPEGETSIMNRSVLRLVLFLTVACAAGFLSVRHALGQEVDDRAAIEESIQSYVDAFNARDAKALAAHWSPEGVYIRRVDGNQIRGRDKLEEEFAAQFADHQGARIEVATESIDFVSPNVALEEGTATIIRPEDAPSQSRYSVVHIKRDGKWMIDRISEEELVSPTTGEQALRELEWMVGTWVDQAEGDMIRTECQWSKNGRFLIRSFTVTSPEQVEMSGMQFVGWDPAQERIRSWVFDSDGGFAEGTWTQKNGRWISQQVATLPDGRRASSTTVMRPLDENRFSWQKINRVVDGEILPSIEEVIIVRE